MKIDKLKQIALAAVILFSSTLFCPAEIEVFVDARKGEDRNEGSREAPVQTLVKAFSLINEKSAEEPVIIKLNPGTYLVDKPIFVNDEKMGLKSGSNLLIEASILPGEEAWKPELMPVILAGSWQGDIGMPGGEVFTTIFFVQKSNVAIRGIKFLGYPHPNSRYIPIMRVQPGLENLKVEQCLFVADKNTPIQVGILADGGGIQVDHCIFYNARNSVVFWRKFDKPAKKNNCLTNSIIYGAYQSGIWTALDDEALVFRNNVVTRCKHAWIKNEDNSSHYRAENCLFAENDFYQTVYYESGPVEEDFGLEEVNITRDGTVSLVMVDNVDDPVPLHYLHVQPGTPGDGLGAGLFMK